MTERRKWPGFLGNLTTDRCQGRNERGEKAEKEEDAIEHGRVLSISKRKERKVQIVTTSKKKKKYMSPFPSSSLSLHVSNQFLLSFSLRASIFFLSSLCFPCLFLHFLSFCFFYFLSHTLSSFVPFLLNSFSLLFLLKSRCNTSRFCDCSSPNILPTGNFTLETSTTDFSSHTFHFSTHQY